MGFGGNGVSPILLHLPQDSPPCPSAGLIQEPSATPSSPHRPHPDFMDHAAVVEFAQRQGQCFGVGVSFEPGG